VFKKYPIHIKVRFCCAIPSQPRGYRSSGFKSSLNTVRSRLWYAQLPSNIRFQSFLGITKQELGNQD